MKIYEYAKSRGVKSKAVVKRLHEMGFDFVKNHLSLVPEKILDELDEYEFPTTSYQKKQVEEIDIAIIGLDYKQLKSKIDMKTSGKKIVILPYFNIIKDLTLFSVIEINEIQYNIYYLVENEIEFFFIDLKINNREKLLGFSDESKIISLFTLGSIELLKLINHEFQVISIHNWPLGLFPLLFEKHLKSSMPNTNIEFSVYGATYKGIYGLEILEELRLAQKDYDKVMYAQSVNLLKAGLVTTNKFDISKEVMEELKTSYLKAFVYDNM